MKSIKCLGKTRITCSILTPAHLSEAVRDGGQETDLRAPDSGWSERAAFGLFVRWTLVNSNQRNITSHLFVKL